MDRRGKKPKARHDEAPHPERSDTKAQARDGFLAREAEPRAAPTSDADARRAPPRHGGRAPRK